MLSLRHVAGWCNRGLSPRHAQREELLPQQSSGTCPGSQASCTWRWQTCLRCLRTRVHAGVQRQTGTHQHTRTTLMAGGSLRAGGAAAVRWRPVAAAHSRLGCREAGWRQPAASPPDPWTPQSAAASRRVPTESVALAAAAAEGVAEEGLARLGGAHAVAPELRARLTGVALRTPTHAVVSHTHTNAAEPQPAARQRRPASAQRAPGTGTRAAARPASPVPFPAPPPSPPPLAPLGAVPDLHDR